MSRNKELSYDDSYTVIKQNALIKRYIPNILSGGKGAEYVLPFANDAL